MSGSNSVNQVRNDVVRSIGRKVTIKMNRGRNQFDIAEGIIAETYPNIFLIKLNNQKNAPDRTITYSYADVLTKDVELIW